MASIGFGLERLGTAAARRRHLAACLAGLVTIAALIGLLRVAFDDDLRTVFTGNTTAFATFDSFRDRFADPELEMLVLVEGPLAESPAAVAALSDLHFELQLSDGVEDVFSMFSLRAPPQEAGEAPPLIAFGQELDDATRRAVRAHPTLGGLTLSQDGRKALFVLSLAPEMHRLERLSDLVPQIRRLAEATLEGTGLGYALTGFPVVRAEIVRLVIRDQLVLNSAGALAGFVLSLIVFRSLVAAVITALPPMLAALWIIGGMGLFGVPITVMSNVLPALAMILAYANSMHLTHAWCRRRMAGEDPQPAAVGAIREIGPATALTALTTMATFLALSLADLHIVRNFAMTGAAVMVVALLAVLTLHPLAAIALGRHWRGAGPAEISLMDRHAWLVTGLVAAALKRPWTISAMGAALTILFASLHLSVPPEHSFREHLSQRHPANSAFFRADDAFEGLLPVHVVVPLEPGESPLSRPVLQRLDAVHQAVRPLPETGQTFSLRNLVQWAGIRDLSEAEDLLAPHLEQLTPVQRGRLIADDGSAVVLTTYLRDRPSWQLHPLIDRIEAAARGALDADIAVTGVTVITARETDRAIANLQVNLGIAIVVTLGLIALAFRRLDHGLVSLLPNVLPIVATGALLFMAGRGMQYTSIIALTVAFGVAVDDTIHFLNRLRLTAGQGRPIADLLLATGKRVGTVLALTTLVLACGLASTALSQLPTVQLFGILCIVTLVVALLSDLLLLPALIAGPMRHWFAHDPTSCKLRSSVDAP